MKVSRLFFYFMVPWVLQFGCAPAKKSTTRVDTVAEVDFCSTIRSVSVPVTLNGQAKYQYFKPAFVEGQHSRLTLDTGNVPFINPIRRAEVRVLDSTGAVVQCGVTDNSGNFSIQIEKPLSDAVYTVQVNSRADNDDLRASVLDKVETKKFYSVEAQVSVTASDSAKNVALLEASARGDLQGGAFHILDMILDTNEFLRANTLTAGCNLCTGFEPIHKVNIFWIPGFNPASYFGEEAGLSFFDSSGSIDSSPSLYILGGSNGDVDNSDTDHFDDSVIIHEYVHFLEKYYWQGDSPGGMHNGNLIIDPRLAFSEGLANYIPSLVMGNEHYIDTFGSPEAGSQLGFYLDLEVEPNSTDGGKDKIITFNPVGEGVYRELSVARALLDYTDSNSDRIYNSSGSITSNSADDLASYSFAYIWLALTNGDFGLNSPQQNFISMGHFNKALYQGIQSSFTNYSAEFLKLDGVRLAEFQTKDESQYAAPLSRVDARCPREIKPIPKRQSAEGYSYADLFLSSDFYEIYHPGGTFTLSLEYQQVSGETVDLDLYVYNENHSISEERDQVKRSANIYSSEKPFPGRESVSLTLAAGTYLVLVNADANSLSGSGAQATYDLVSGGKYLCAQ